MIAQIPWLDREFVFGQPIGLFPILLERLRGTPARAKESEVEITARHPRLQKPMRLLDWLHFLAEQDDHHLALARAVMTVLNHQRIRKER